MSKKNPLQCILEANKHSWFFNTFQIKETIYHESLVVSSLVKKQDSVFPICCCSWLWHHPFSFCLHVLHVWTSICLSLSASTRASSPFLSSSAPLSPCSHCSLGMPPVPILAETSSIHAPHVSVMNPQLFISPSSSPVCWTWQMTGDLQSFAPQGSR